MQVFFFIVVCFDAKINFDDNAKFRQSKVFAMDDGTETDEREIEAGIYGLNYIPLDGNIACMGKCFRAHKFHNFIILYIYIYIYIYIYR